VYIHSIVSHFESGGLAQFREAFKYGVPLTIMAFAIIGVLWYVIGYADVPVKVILAPIVNATLTSQTLLRQELLNRTIVDIQKFTVANNSIAGRNDTSNITNILPELAPREDGTLYSVVTFDYSRTEAYNLSFYSAIRPNFTDLCTTLNAVGFVYIY
jgi:hypothetical protein